MIFFETFFLLRCAINLIFEVNDLLLFLLIKPRLTVLRFTVSQNVLNLNSPHKTSFMCKLIVPDLRFTGPFPSHMAQ